MLEPLPVLHGLTEEGHAGTVIGSPSLGLIGAGIFAVSEGVEDESTTVGSPPAAMSQAGASVLPARAEERDRRRGLRLLPEAAAATRRVDPCRREARRVDPWLNNSSCGEAGG